MSQIRWTAQAAYDLQSIHDFIACDSVDYAAAVLRRLVAAIESLERFPWSGRRVPEHVGDDLRELVRPPYRIVYRVIGESIHVITLFRCWRMAADPAHAE
jgi:plasmid stabilization system protein ParE